MINRSDLRNYNPDELPPPPLDADVAPDDESSDTPIPQTDSMNVLGDTANPAYFAGSCLWGMSIDANGAESFYQVGTVDHEGKPHYYTEDGARYTGKDGRTLSFVKKGDAYIDLGGRPLTLSPDGTHYQYTDPKGKTYAFTKQGDKFVGADGIALEFTKAGSEFLPDRIFAGGKDLNRGSKTYDYNQLMSGTDPAQADLRNALIDLKEHMHGTVKSGQIYAIINQGKALVLEDGANGSLAVKEFHFVSGNHHANDPRYENVALEGPTPATLPGSHYTLEWYTDDFKGRGRGPGYMIKENGDTHLHNGRSDCAWHTLGSHGVTWGCEGFPQPEMAEISRNLGHGKYDFVVGNTNLAEQAAATVAKREAVASNTAKSTVSTTPAPNNTAPAPQPAVS